MRYPKIRTFLPAIFVLLLVVGLLSYKGYGVTWDEPYQIRIGQVNLDYVTGTSTELFTFRNKYYGPLYEMALLLVQRLTASLPISSYDIRHIANFALWATGIFPMFWLSRKLVSNKFLNYLTVFWYIASPRLFADAFYNTKDIPFMVFLLWGTYTFSNLIDARNTLTRIQVIQHSLVTSLAIITRIIGMVLPAITTGLFTLIYFDKAASRKKTVTFFSLYTLVTMLGVYIGTPLLWCNPLNFFGIIKQMSRYPWNSPVLFEGIIVRAKYLPWYYIPKWIVISTPSLYIIFFIIGVCIIFWNFFSLLKKKLAYESNSNLLLFACTFIIFAPIFVTIILKSTVYDAWRHFFFIYPYILLIGIFGLGSLGLWLNNIPRFNNSFYIRGGKVLLILHILFVISTMVSLHPLENVYFNPLMVVGDKPSALNYELDYWGVSNRLAYDFITSQNQEALPIRVYSTLLPGKRTYEILTKKQKNMTTIVSDTKSADYIIDVFRTTEYKPTSEFSKIHTIYRYKTIPIATIYKRNN